MRENRVTNNIYDEVESVLDRPEDLTKIIAHVNAVRRSNALESLLSIFLLIHQFSV
jgi:hypothetical protein